MKRYSIREFNSNFSKLLKEAEEAGIVVTKFGIDYLEVRKVGCYNGVVTKNDECLTNVVTSSMPKVGTVVTEMGMKSPEGIKSLSKEDRLAYARGLLSEKEQWVEDDPSVGMEEEKVEKRYVFNEELGEMVSVTYDFIVNKVGEKKAPSVWRKLEVDHAK